MTTVLKSKNRGRFFLILLMLVFIGPIIASYGLYYFRNYVPEILSNGTLILPPLDLNKLPLYDTQNQKITLKKFGGDWVMLYVEPEKCNKICIDTLYKMRQIRIRLGKDMDRVKRVILTYQGFRDNTLNEYLQSLYKGTLHIQTPGSDLNKFLAKLPPHDRAIKTGHLYLVDPLGNVMMSYELSQKPKDIYSDMKRLLKVSRIG